MGSMFRIGITAYLAVWITVIGMIPTDGWALMIPFETSAGPAAQRINDLEQIQRHLEAKLVSERLAELGLSSEEVTARLSTLTDEQVHQFARNLDGLQVGGIDPAVTFILIFVGAVLLAILFIYAVRPLFVDRHPTTAPVVVEPSHAPPTHHH
jgi:hypothetical protein